MSARSISGKGGRTYSSFMPSSSFSRARFRRVALLPLRFGDSLSEGVGLVSAYFGAVEVEVRVDLRVAVMLVKCGDAKREGTVVFKTGTLPRLGCRSQQPTQPPRSPVDAHLGRCTT